MRNLLLFLLISFGAHSEINPERQKQLDSIVTNIDRVVLKNLDSLQLKLHNEGNNDEERVFMYFGLFATHYKYDKNRAGKTRVKEYTNYYTAYSRSGVCRDFANLFKELCHRSKIPCLVALGNVKIPFYGVPKALITNRLKGPNHAWNVVRFNGKWHLMDPTWSTISKTEKYYGKDSKGNKIYLGKVKIPTRTYYDISSAEMYKGRKAIHPAFYLDDNIYTFKTARKKSNKKELYRKSYEYDSILSKLYYDNQYRFSKSYTEEIKKYSKRNAIGYDLAYLFGFLDLKRTSKNKLTPEQCEQHLIELKEIVEYMKKEGVINLTKAYNSHEILVRKKSVKLKTRVTT